MTRKTAIIAGSLLAFGCLAPATAQAATTTAQTPAGTATVLSGGRLSWDGGAVQLVPADIQAFSCDNGYLCLYANRGGNGRRLQFRDHYCQNLTDYNFNDTVESYWNRNNSGFWLYKSINCRSGDTRWWVSAGARNSDMGPNRNVVSAVG